MTDLALLPHNDDELFCSYTLLRNRPHVVAEDVRLALAASAEEDA